MKGNRYTLSIYNALSPLGASNYLYGMTIPQPCVVQEWRQAVYVAAPNDASNYWQISLKSNTATLATFSTSALSAATWILKVLANLAKAVQDSDVYLHVYATKVGSPGGLSAMPAVIYVE